MKPLRWGILGTAAIARKAYVPAFRASPMNEAVAVASRNLGKAEAFAEEHGLSRAYGSYVELLADPDIDAVYIPLPVSLHHEWSLRGADAGKAILVEKPIAANAHEAKQMVEAFAAKGLVFSEALMYRYHPLTQKVLALVREGAIGKLRMIHASFNASVSDRCDIRFRKETAGGALLDLGVYCVNFMRLITGEEPCEIKAMARAGEVDESLTALLRFPSGVLGYLGCGLDTEFDCTYSVSGSKGRLFSGRGATCAWPGEAFELEHYRNHKKEVMTSPEANHYVMILDDFARAVCTQGPMRHPPEDSIRNMTVIEEIMRQARVEIPGRAAAEIPG